VEICELKAEVKDVKIDVDCVKNLKAKISAPLLEQALVNLIDNAIKHSDNDSQVQVKASADGGRVSISVIDQGCGIKKAHLPRLFERFYRVDKTNSREMGGTGLGLAIVKHIMLLHDGTVDVRSTFGQGSEFTISLISS
jgi:two-component system phosphate regulon sensor histidine kinase PhoR